MLDVSISLRSSSSSSRSSVAVERGLVLVVGREGVVEVVEEGGEGCEKRWEGEGHARVWR